MSKTVFVTPPPMSTKASAKPKKPTIKRRTCTSRFDTGMSILECVLSPSHYDFHRNDKHVIWTDKDQMTN